MTDEQQTTLSPRQYELKLQHYRQKVSDQEEQIATLRVGLTELQEEVGRLSTELRVSQTPPDLPQLEQDENVQEESFPDVADPDSR